MNRWCLLMLLWVAAQCGAETLSHGRFQNLAVYRPGGEVQRVVLFLSGEQGWNAQLSRSAQLLASQGALVAGIDSRAVRGPGARRRRMRVSGRRPGEPQSFSASVLSSAEL